MFLSRIEVYTYKKAQLIQYISHRGKRRSESLYSHKLKKGEWKNAFDDSYNGIDIDLTSAIKLLINNEYSFKYPLESMLENLDGFDE